MFPGYVFIELESEISAEQIIEYKKLKDFYHFLPSNNDIQYLPKKDMELLTHFMRFGEIGPSLVTFDENDRIEVLEGPLMGLEGCIKKVDKRKKRAKISVEFQNNTYTLDLSFDVLQKK